MDRKSYNEKYNETFFDRETGEYRYRYPHASLTADCVVFGFDGKSLKLLLVERGFEPYKGMWALPGGFIKVAAATDGEFDKSIEETAKRELREETSLSDVFLQQFKVFSKFDRDPRERVITVAFIALVSPCNYQKTVASTVAGDDASNAMWWDEDSLPPLAFDHADIIREAKEYLADMIRVKPVAFNLLDSTFTLSELQNVYEAITGKNFDRRNFQRKAMQSGLINEVSGFDQVFHNTVTEHMPECSVSGLLEDSEVTDESIMPEKRISPRKRKKFFTFRNKQVSDIDDTNEEGSIKDLFNF